MDSRYLALALVMVAGPAFACGPGQGYWPDEGDFGRPGHVISVAAPEPVSVASIDGLDDSDVVDLDLGEDASIDDMLDVGPDIGRPPLQTWELPVRDALAFDAWPADLNQGREDHRMAMDLVDHHIIPLEGGRFEPDRPVTRIELLDWLAQVEEWVRVAQTGVTLRGKWTLAKRTSPIGLILRSGMKQIHGETPVDMFWMIFAIASQDAHWGRCRAEAGFIPRSFTPTRLEIALWLRSLAQAMCREGHPPSLRLDPRSLAHLPVLLDLLEDPSPRVREVAHRVLVDVDPAVLATLIAQRPAAWFRDATVLRTLPATAVKLALAESPIARAQFVEAMRVLRGLHDTRLDVQFLEIAGTALKNVPLEKPLPAVLMAEMADVMAAHRWTEQLDGFLGWGQPALEAIVPQMVDGKLDHHWVDRMPWSLEAGWDTRGKGVVSQLMVLVRETRLPMPARLAALSRLERLGEPVPRETLRAVGLLPDAPDEVRARRVASAGCRHNLDDVYMRQAVADGDVRRLTAQVHQYQLYLAIAVAIIGLIVFGHLVVLVPMLVMRVVRKLRALLAPEAPRPPCQML